MAGRGPAEHQAVLRRDAGQPGQQRPRHPRGRRRRARGRRPARRRQHRADAVPGAPDRARRRHRRPLRDEVPRRPRHHDRRRAGRRRHVRLRRTTATFPGFNEPDPSYHGLKYWEALGPGAYAAKARVQLLRDTGAAIAPFNSFLILQGIETLSLRIERHVSERAGAGRVAGAARRGREGATTPACRRARSTPRRRSTCRAARARSLSFDLRGGVEAGRKFVDGTELHSQLVNIGDVRSLIVHPASTTHSQLDRKSSCRSGVTPGLVRLAVGLEGRRGPQGRPGSRIQGGEGRVTRPTPRAPPVAAPGGSVIRRAAGSSSPSRAVRSRPVVRCPRFRSRTRPGAR